MTIPINRSVYSDDN